MKPGRTFDEQSDVEIIEAARTGDERAWDAIYETLYRPLLGYIRLRGADDPENLLGETFLRLARSIHRFRGDLVGLRSYAMTIAVNLVRDQARRNAVRPTLHFVTPSDIEPVTPAGQGIGATPEDAALESASLSELQPLLHQLTTDQQHVLYLRFVGDLSVLEVARALDRTPGAVKQLQHRAIARLRETMQQPSADSKRETR